MRTKSLVEGEYYHILNRSIAGFNIFNSENNSLRFLDLLRYYRYDNRFLRFSHLKKLSVDKQIYILSENKDEDKLVEIIAYCLMPTHFHLILKQLKPDGISKFMSLVENSYTRYFNLRHKRKGPLWESRFKNILIDSDRQLMHLTRYVHLNPVSARIIDKPEDWQFSSYMEYICPIKNASADIAKFRVEFEVYPTKYKKFTMERIDEQRELSYLKKQLLDDYTG